MNNLDVGKYEEVGYNRKKDGDWRRRRYRNGII